MVRCLIALPDIEVEDRVDELTNYLLPLSSVVKSNMRINAADESWKPGLRFVSYLKNQ